MSDAPPELRQVRIYADVYRKASALAALEDKGLPDLLAEYLRPVLDARLAEEMGRQLRGPAPGGD